MILTPDDRRRLHRASELMLRPFDHATPVRYLTSVARELQPLIGAFAAICGTRDPDGSVAVDSAEWEPRIVADFARWKLDDRGTQRAIAAGMEVATMRTVIGDAWDLYHADPMVQQWYIPNGVHDAAAYVLHWPEDDALATIELHSRTFGTPRCGEEGEALLALLLPSLKAGSRLLYTVGRQRQALASQMDALGISVCVCARDGHVVHQSETLRLLLADDPEGGCVVKCIPSVARAAARSVSPSRSSSRPLPSAAVHQLVQTTRGRYRLSAALATDAMQFGFADVLVTVAALPDRGPGADEIGTRFNLSRREHDVALRLSRGMRNDAIAAQLGISPHTVRRHTERVLAKLGVSNRAEVAARLLAVRDGKGRAAGST